MEGQVLKASNNIFYVRPEDGSPVRECRIKGKQLAAVRGEVNVLAVGDRVSVNDSGMIEARLDRKSVFKRWNALKRMNQTVAANIDAVAIVTSPASPPMRARFIDRAIACVHGARVIVVMNKADLEISEEDRMRFELYGRIGFETCMVSAVTEQGLDKLRNAFSGASVALVGQSGVGKSSLVNALLSRNERTVGDLCEKYDRGRHTTTMSEMLDLGEFRLIDTPGVREILAPHGSAFEILPAFPEFEGFECAYPNCLHEDEPGCGVRFAVEKGIIDEERYDSYLRILDSLELHQPVWATKEKKRK